MKNSSRLSRLQKVGLVSAGVVTGAVIAATGLASAADDSATPAPSTQSQQDTQTSDAKGHMHHRAEEELTGDTADKVTAAVTAKYPDATIDRLEKDADGESVYEAHITKADGTHAKVLLDKDFAITGEQTGGPHGGPMGGPVGHEGGGHMGGSHEGGGHGHGRGHHDESA